MPKKLLNSYMQEMKQLFDSIDSKEFEALIFALKEAYDDQRQVFVFGNGGSGVNASHFASDMNKGVSCGQEKRFKIICLNDNMAVFSSYANDCSYADVFVEQLKNFMNVGDLVIGISGSGNSENVLKTINYANDYKGKTFGVCGYGGGKLKDISQQSLVIESHDMQKVEDIHMMIFHCVMQWFMDSINLISRDC